MPPDILSSIVDETRPEPGNETLSDSDPELPDEAVVASISCGEDEDEEEDEDIQQDIERKQTVTPFTLKGTDSNFFQRSQGIFGGLLCTEKAKPYNPIITSNETLKLPDSPEQDSLVSTAEPPSFSASKTSASSCSENSRKRPIQRLPDYLKHPERWTKYSLEDVPDTTDHTNRNTALNFLADLQQQRQGKELPGSASSHSYNQDSSSPGESKILFTRTQKVVRGSSAKIERPHCQVQGSEAWNDEEQEESEGLGECKETTAAGFHGVKKRSRKNIRSKADPSGEEDAS
ncbi:uncharacterized protein LOC495455 [Xenopus laevis]|uniref:U5 small nuclear ribonucleoprotein TSSC4 n=1 Tax=Xenopus laevis TaxID=8355 RepID=Q5U4R4_XENLA|nr:uncharacterized protein LOC495455 [Xenopus laevis]AAH84982.1 LOC495455 protein [Xenopus laevis]